MKIFKKKNSRLFNYLLSGSVLVFIILVLLFSNVFSLVQKEKFNEQLVSKCRYDEQKKIKPIGSGINVIQDSMLEIKSADYVFEFPYSDWKIVTNLAEQFEESIRFPKILHSIYFSYPGENKYPMFIDKDNDKLFVFTVSEDYCVPVEEWASKMHNFENYTQDIQTINGKKWYLADSLTGVPIHQAVFVHHSGYHYEFNFYARDKDQYEKDKDLMKQIMKSMKFF